VTGAWTIAIEISFAWIVLLLEASIPGLQPALSNLSNFHECTRCIHDEDIKNNHKVSHDTDLCDVASFRHADRSTVRVRLNSQTPVAAKL
jgi:hypothetical protein